MTARERVLLIDVLLEDLAWTEGHNSTGSDADFLPGSRVSPFSRPFATHHKIPKSRDLHRLSLLQHRLQQIEDEFHDVGRLFFRDADLLKYLVGNIGLDRQSVVQASAVGSGGGRDV